MLTVAETAKRLGMKEQTIRLWIFLRRIEHVKLGRSVRIPEVEIERLIAEGTIPRREQRPRV